MTKMHHERPKYPKILENDQNAPKMTSTTLKTFKMTEIPLNPQNKQNTLETSENDQNTHKLCQNILDLFIYLFILWGYFARF